MEAQDNFDDSVPYEDPAMLLEKEHKIRTIDYRPYWTDAKGFMYDALGDLYRIDAELTEQDSDLRVLQGVRLYNGQLQTFAYSREDRVLRLYTSDKVIIHTFEGVREIEHNLLSIVDLRVRDSVVYEDRTYHPYVDGRAGGLVWAHNGKSDQSGQELVALRAYQFIIDLRSFLINLPLASPQYTKFQWAALTQALSKWLRGDGYRMRLHPGAVVPRTVLERYLDFSRAYKFYGRLVNFDAGIGEEAQYFKSMVDKLQYIAVTLEVVSSQEEFRKLLTDLHHEARQQGQVRLAGLLRYLANGTDPEQPVEEYRPS